jgi:hypothetical protein
MRSPKTKFEQPAGVTYVSEGLEKNTTRVLGLQASKKNSRAAGCVAREWVYVHGSLGSYRTSAGPVVP